MSKRRPGFPCAVCGCGMEAGCGIFLFASAIGRAPRWPQRKRLFRECAECGHLQTAQWIARYILEVA